MHPRSGLTSPEWPELGRAEQKVTEYVCASRRMLWPATPSAPIRFSTITCRTSGPPALPQRGCEHLHGKPLVPGRVQNRPPKNGGHRALADIIESLDELRYYRKAFMATMPRAARSPTAVPRTVGRGRFVRQHFVHPFRPDQRVGEWPEPGRGRAEGHRIRAALHAGRRAPAAGRQHHRLR